MIVLAAWAYRYAGARAHVTALATNALITIETTATIRLQNLFCFIRFGYAFRVRAADAAHARPSGQHSRIVLALAMAYWRVRFENRARCVVLRTLYVRRRRLRTRHARLTRYAESCARLLDCR